jgi:hypothetical protein
LHKELENIQEEMEKFPVDTAKQTNSLFEELNGQIITLYREIEERFEETEITLISKEALDLSNCVEQGKMFFVAKQIQSLRQNINSLFEHRLPSLAHRKIIQLALKLSDSAEGLLADKETSLREKIKLIQLLKGLLLEAVARAHMELSAEEGELAIELYEIAELFHEKKRQQEAQLRLKLLRSRLTPSQRRRIEVAGSSPEALIRALLEIAGGDPCIEWEESSHRESVVHILQA